MHMMAVVSIFLDFCCLNFDVASWMVQIEGNYANAGDAIMLDKDGYVSETNATNIVSFSHFSNILVSLECMRDLIS